MPKKSALIIIVVTSILVNACKKGEDDPLISLRSRKARLAGEWRLSEGTLTIGSVNLTNFTRYTEIYTFSSLKYSCTSTGEGLVPVVSSGNYLLNIVFEKDGTFNFSEQFDSKELQTSGYWDFNNGIGEEKEKESVLLAIKDVTSGKTGGYHLFNQNSIDFTYKIKELRNEKMVLSAEVPVYLDANGEEQTFYAEFTFIQ